MQRLIRIVGVFLLLCGASLAQDPGDPSPEFLYREGDRFIMVKGYTGETTEFIIDVPEKSRIEWSPDGQYLLVKMPDSKMYAHHCINLYEFDKQEWVDDDPIACGVQTTLFSADATQLFFVTSDAKNQQLNVYTLSSQTIELLYETDAESDTMPHGIDNLKWSPSEYFLLFEHYIQVMGGTHNILVVMNTETLTTFIVRARNTYYASYYPVWSDTEDWFLITLKDEYVTSGTIPDTNHEGDVYLVNTQTGDKHRLTYTPTRYKQNVHWTEDGEIAYVEVVETEVNLTVEQALIIDEIPEDQIVMPESISIEGFIEDAESASRYNILISPDYHYGAWVTPEYRYGGEDNPPTQLNFGSIHSWSRDVNFSIPIPDNYHSDSILIGWRPSNYQYFQG